MNTACADQQHKFQPSHQLANKFVLPFKDIEIPPRKLLLSHHHGHNIQDSSSTMQLPYKTSLHKYLPCNRYNNDNDSEQDNDADPYATDHFRMCEFKVRRCTRSRSHDWTDCPFAHPGEKARRRDPRRYRYSSTVCSDFRRAGGCPRGDDCEFAHGVFECWLHPTRYRTEACKDGKNCKRKVCFFAHSSRELRLLPEASPKYKSTSGSCSSSPMSRNNHCCFFCHSVTSSPTSTLLGLSQFSRSPSVSPPLSPVKQAQRKSLSEFSAISRYSDRISKFGTEVMTYKDVLNELMSSLENRNFCEVSSPMAGGGNSLSSTTANVPWLDVSLNGKEQHQQFALSPNSRPSASPSWSSGEHLGTAKSKGYCGRDEEHNHNGGVADPDLNLEWVNELLM